MATPPASPARPQDQVRADRVPDRRDRVDRRPGHVVGLQRDDEQRRQRVPDRLGRAERQRQRHRDVQHDRRRPRRYRLEVHHGELHRHADLERAPLRRGDGRQRPQPVPRPQGDPRHVLGRRMPTNMACTDRAGSSFVADGATYGGGNGAGANGVLFNARMDQYPTTWTGGISDAPGGTPSRGRTPRRTSTGSTSPSRTTRARPTRPTPRRSPGRRRTPSASLTSEGGERGRVEIHPAPRPF